MRKLSFVLGSILLLTLFSILIWASTQAKAFTITQVSCVANQADCSDQLSELVTQDLLGKSLFITDFKTQGTTPKYEVLAFTKQLPGQIKVEVRPTTSLILKDGTLTATSNPEQVIAAITSLFDQAQISVQKVAIFPDHKVVVVKLEKEQALLGLDQPERDAQKVILIKKHLRLAEIDTSIAEIDARYQLPVLRTQLSEF